MPRRRFVRHPCRDAGDRSVGLRNGNQIGATVGVLLDDKHRLAAPRMERIVDPPLDRVLAGSMSLLRAGPGSPEYRCSAPADALQSCAAAYRSEEHTSE